MKCFEITLENVEIAIAKIRAVIGPAYVITHTSEVRERSKDLIPAVKLPSAFIYPANQDEIQAIIKIANECKLPLWPCSKGKNWGYGAASPVLEGSLVLVLERMNTIITVNEELAYAIVEPGVTYRQLNHYLKEHNIKLWCDCTDGPPDGSVMGNALDRGVGLTAYSDHFGHVCGMEVVLPTGELIRTGGGEFNNCKVWNTHKWGVGPYLEGLFSQSNFGIVTKIGIWLMPEPETSLAYTFDLRDDKDLSSAVDAIRTLALKGVVVGAGHFFNDVVALAILTQYPPELLQSGSSLSPELRGKLRRRHGIAPWTLGGGIYGSTAEVDLRKRQIKKALGALGKVDFIDGKKASRLNRLIPWLKKAKAVSRFSPLIDVLLIQIFGKSLEFIEAAPHVYSLMQGIPSDYFVRHAYFKSRTPKPDTNIDPARDNCGLIWFAPISPLTGRNVLEVIELCRPLFEKYGFDFYVVLLLQNPRAVIVLMAVMYRKDDPEEAARAQALYEELCRVTAEAGYPQYRTSVSHMERIFDRVPELRNLIDRIKSSLDPNNIMAPGKYGIGIMNSST